MSNEQSEKRWFSTGYLANGVGSVSPETHALNDAAVIRCGEAKGHGLWIDDEFCASVVSMANQAGDKGIKARFGHPDMCSDALGTFLGRWKSLTAGPDGVVKGTLFLSSTASESPKGDLRKYVEEMAAKEPDHFGTSIVFSRDFEAEENFIVANGGCFCFGSFGYDGFIEQGRTTKREEIPDGKDYYINTEGFKSPDPRNGKNMPHARCSKLHAADLVDDPAATDGMFAGIGGTALASKVSEYLDTHPAVLKAFSDDPQMVKILGRYSNELRPFIDRYTANRKETQMSIEANGAVAESPATVEEKPAVTPETEQPKAEDKPAETPAEPVEEAAKSNAEVEALKKQNEAIALELKKAQEVADKALKAQKDAEQKLSALSNGEEPLTATPAPAEKPAGSVWERARLSKK